jgi:chromosome segregation ATPase
LFTERCAVINGQVFFLQAELEALKLECAALREEAAAAVQDRNYIKTDYDTYKKRVQSVLAEQDSQYNRIAELESCVQASATVADAKSRELQRVLARLSEMEAVNAQVFFTFT